MIEETYLPLTLSVPNITDAEFQEFCEEYPDYFLEYSAEGELIIMPPTDPETGSANASFTSQLWVWNRSTGRGITTDATAGFILPNGARRSPDAAWISRERFQRGRSMCPEFIIELLSPFDRPKKLHLKMLEWMANGVELGWMINPRTQTVTIYRPGVEPEARSKITEIAGEGPVAGFVLDLASVWNPI